MPEIFQKIFDPQGSQRGVCDVRAKRLLKCVCDVRACDRFWVCDVRSQFRTFLAQFWTFLAINTTFYAFPWSYFVFVIKFSLVFTSIITDMY